MSVPGMAVPPLPAARPRAILGRRMAAMGRAVQARGPVKPKQDGVTFVQPGRVISCGEGRVDIAQRRLLDRHGHELPLRNKSFDVLRVLAQRFGQVVMRSELLDLVWPGVYVTDDNITQCVVEIRRQLRNIEGVRIRTVSRYGYALDLALPATPELAGPA